MSLPVAIATAIFAAAQSNARPVITNVADLCSTVSDAATTGVCFEIDAEVTFPYRARPGSFAVSDDTGVAVISDERADKDVNTVVAGDIVHMTGVTDDTVHGVVYAGCRSLRITARHEPRPPTEISAKDFIRGTFDYRPVVITGFIRDAFRDEIDPRVVFLVLVCGGETIYTALTTEENDHTAFWRFVGAEVSISGLCRPSAHGTRRQIGRFLKIDNVGDIHVVTPPAEDPFDVPDIRIPNQIRAQEMAAIGRRRTTGHVIAVWQSDNLLLRTDARRIMRVELADSAAPRYGQHIEVAGLPETDLYNINLTRAIWQPAPGKAFTADAPEEVTATTLMADAQGRTRINTGYHGRTIRLHGLVRSLPTIGNNYGRLYMECERYIVPVDASSCPEALRDVCVGSSVSVTGACVMETENWHPNSVFPHVKGFMVVVREANDVRVLSRPPWWTPTRLMVVIGALLAALSGVFLWNRSLNRIAERRGEELAEERVARATSDMKVGERTRLAIELHDALSQNLTGVSLEITTATKLAAKDTNMTLRHLDIAARSLKSCRDELRNCIWDLRNYALEEKDMNAAVKRTLAPFVDDVDLIVRFNVPRERLPDDTAHALLRIVRELVMNAIRHGGAQTVRVAGCIEGERILFSVVDDGCGFDPSCAASVRDGHFGLQGIRERINHFGGDMSVESEIGRGSKVSVSLRLPLAP